MATSEVAYGKILMAANAGLPIPPGWAVDSLGEPTESAADAMHGALLPAAGPKGFGLSFMLDALMAFGGAVTSPFVDPLHGDSSRPQRIGQLFVALRAPAETAGTFTESMGALTDEIRLSRTSPPVLYPGEPELMRKRENGSRISVADDVFASLSAVALRYGVALPPDAGRS
jgi:LDH2 family malate/lactate/ureidoglycolate dehydrogenase